MKKLKQFLFYSGCLGILFGIAVIGLGINRLGGEILIGGSVFMLIQYLIRASGEKENPDLGAAVAKSYRRRHRPVAHG